MTILALEFSSARRSVAVAREGVVLSEAAEQIAVRATNAFGLIEKVLAETKISREEIEGIAVGLGPGSYTGIRAAIALAQGWQLARGVKLFGVSSVAAMARQAQAEEFFGRVSLVVDAQRREFYQSTWEISESRCEEISPLKIVSAGELGLEKVVAGPAAERILFPSAAAVAGRAFVAGMISTDLEPIYLREISFVKAAGLAAG